MATFFMNLTLPVERRTAASTWATTLNTALTTVDSHDHASGNGQRLTPAGIDIDADMDVSGYSFTSVSKIGFSPEGSSKSLDNSVWTDAGELTFIDGASNVVQITQAGAINISGFGGIDGDYSSTTATVLYVDSTSTYSFYDSLSALATARCKDVTVVDVEGTSASLASLNQDGSASLQAVSASGSTTVSGAAAFTGNVSGRGIIPVGAVVALATDLAGVSIPTGFLELNGQTVADSSSPMNGVVLPDLSNSRFIMGSTTAGTLGGASSYTLLTANMPSHTHTIDHGHPLSGFGLFGTTVIPTSTHTHGIAHGHIFQGSFTFGGIRAFYSNTSADRTSTSISTGGSDYFAGSVNNANSGGGVTDIFNPSTGSFYTSGVVSAPSGSGSSAVSDTPSATQTITITGGVTDHSGSSGSTGSGTAVSLLPKYITTKFVVRFK